MGGAGRRTHRAVRVALDRGDEADGACSFGRVPAWRIQQLTRRLARLGRRVLRRRAAP
jgi:hypothetical protein